MPIEKYPITVRSTAISIWHKLHNAQLLRWDLHRKGKWPNGPTMDRDRRGRVVGPVGVRLYGVWSYNPSLREPWKIKCWAIYGPVGKWTGAGTTAVRSQLVKQRPFLPGQHRPTAATVPCSKSKLVREQIPRKTCREKKEKEVKGFCVMGPVELRGRWRRYLGTYLRLGILEIP